MATIARAPDDQARLLRLNSIWYLVYEGGETHLGYDCGRIRIVFERNTWELAGNTVTPIALLFGRGSHTARHKTNGVFSIEWLVSEILRFLRLEAPSGGPYQAIQSSPPYDEDEYAIA